MRNKKFLNIAYIVLSTFVLLISIRGIKGNINENTVGLSSWKENGPFELSPERGRIALTYSIVENNSFAFRLPIARFVAPDVAYANGHYASLFAPGLSFLLIPGYLVGRMFNISQVGTFAVISIFAILNMILIRKIVNKITGKTLFGTLAGLIFVFATPAFPYAVTLYQHHVSTFLVLLSIYVLLNSQSLKAICLVLFLCAFSIPLDNPNAIFLFPIGLYAISKLFSVEILQTHTKIHFRYWGIVCGIIALIPLMLFMAFNLTSNGNPFAMSGTLTTAKIIGEDGLPVAQTPKPELNASVQSTPVKKTAVGFFKTRNILNGFYIHLLSPDRGIIYYTPVLLLSVFGLVKFNKKYKDIKILMLIVAGFVLLLYSMWGDPWGGWAFGDRYMIPAYAVLSIFLGAGLSRINKNAVLIFLFAITMIYSIAVNTLGALTTNMNPPAVEAVALSQVTGKNERYSYDRNWEYLLSQGSKSFIYQTYLSSRMTAQTFYFLVVGVIAGVTTSIYIYSLIKPEHNEA